MAYPFQLRLYADYASAKLTSAELVEILDTIIAYLFRRAVCRIPTNSLNKTFATLAAAIDTDDYVGSVCGRLLTLRITGGSRPTRSSKRRSRRPTIYHLKRRGYFFRAMENHGRKEEVSTAEYTIEHIMPQNASPAWQSALVRLGGGPRPLPAHPRKSHAHRLQPRVLRSPVP